MEVQGPSDFFQCRYYRISKMLLESTGQWPYHSVRTRLVIVTLIVLVGTTGVAPQAVAFVKHLSDWNVLLEIGTSLIFDSFIATKFLFSIFNSKKIKKLLDHIRADWNALARDRSVDILHEYAERGRNMTIVYAVGLYTICFLFMIPPIVPKIIDNLLKNGTEPGTFPVPVDYLLIDEQKYYFYIVLHLSVGMFLAFQVVIANDTLLIVYIYHGCGLYAVLGHKLQLISSIKTSAKPNGVPYVLGKADVNFKDLASRVIRHNEAIKYAELVETTYSWCIFFMLGFNVFLITITGLQIVIRTIGPQETLKLVLANMASIGQLYIECYMAHVLAEYSISIRDYIYNSEWYTVPLKAQKVLLFMIVRCNVPCKMTAGNFVVISMGTFTAVLKICLSYFNFLRSA